MKLITEAETDNPNRGLDNFATMRKPNSINVLLYNYKCRHPHKIIA